MALITLTQFIRRPVDEVFNTVIDAGNYAAWNPTITSSRRLGEGEIGEGSRFEWKLKGFGKVIQELQEFKRNERVRIVPNEHTVAVNQFPELIGVRRGRVECVWPVAGRGLMR